MKETKPIDSRMAGYESYETRGHNTYNGMAPMTEGWTKTSYADSDDVVTWRGSEPPLGSYVPTESYVVKTERIIEKIHTPTVIEYKSVSPAKLGAERTRWGTAPTAVDDRPPKVEEFITQLQTEVAQPPHSARPQLLAQGMRRSPDVHSPSDNYHNKHSYPSSEPILSQSDNRGRRLSPVHDPSPERNLKVQTEIPRAAMTRPGLFHDGTKHLRDVRSPPPAEYKSSETEYGARAAGYKPSYPLGEYRTQNNAWGRPSSPVHDTDLTRSAVKPAAFTGNLGRQTAQLQPAPAPRVAEYLHNSASPPRDNRTENNPWLRNSPSGPLLSGGNGRQTPNPSSLSRASNQPLRSGFNNYDTDYTSKLPDSYEVPSDHYAAAKYNHRPAEPSSPPAWARPGLGGWATGAGRVTPVTRPTNNINQAMKDLTAALQQFALTRPSPQQNYYDTKNDHYEETIDSREAQSRYGSYSGPSRPMEDYTTTIDSQEALRRYGGAAV